MIASSYGANAAVKNQRQRGPPPKLIYGHFQNGR
jgi:hypothetical protein